MVKHPRLRVFAVAGIAAYMLSAVAAAQKPAPSKDKEQDKHPSLKLTARPPIGMSPARVVLTADVNGGPNDSEDYYCPTIEWDWGDGTMSENSSDCDPYEAGKSSIQRHFSGDHTYNQAGQFKVTFKLKQKTKQVGAVSTNVKASGTCSAQSRSTDSLGMR